MFNCIYKASYIYYIYLQLDFFYVKLLKLKSMNELLL